MLVLLIAWLYFKMFPFACFTLLYSKSVAFEILYILSIYHLSSAEKYVRIHMLFYLQLFLVLKNRHEHFSFIWITKVDILDDSNAAIKLLYLYFIDLLLFL